MDDIYNVNAEYERVFGKRNRRTLFASDDEDYLALRWEIIHARRSQLMSDKLPFEEVYASEERNEYSVFSDNLFSPVMQEDWEVKSQMISRIVGSLLQSCCFYKIFGALSNGLGFL